MHYLMSISKNVSIKAYTVGNDTCLKFLVLIYLKGSKLYLARKT